MLVNLIRCLGPDTQEYRRPSSDPQESNCQRMQLTFPSSLPPFAFVVRCCVYLSLAGSRCLWQKTFKATVARPASSSEMERIKFEQWEDLLHRPSQDSGCSANLTAQVPFQCLNLTTPPVCSVHPKPSAVCLEARAGFQREPSANCSYHQATVRNGSRPRLDGLAQVAHPTSLRSPRNLRLGHPVNLGTEYVPLPSLGG